MISTPDSFTHPALPYRSHSPAGWKSWFVKMECSMSSETADRAPEDPNAQLETALIDEFLLTRGLDRRRLRDLPEAQATQVRTEASAYATARLTELETRAHFMHEIHGITRMS
jgi:hypothetical protein